MIMTAILSVVLPNFGYDRDYNEDWKENGKPKAHVKCGSYVIRETQDNKFCYELYDKQNKFLVRSFNCYVSVDDVKEAIRVTRKNGEIAEVEDRTVNWIKEANHPKFEMYKENDFYYYKLSVDNKTLLFKSEPYDALPVCKKQLSKAVLAVKSSETYISIEKLFADEASQYIGMKPVSFSGEEVKNESANYKRQEEKHEVKQPTQVIQEETENKGLYVDNDSIVFSAGEKKTLWELYAELPEEQRKFFDGLRKAAQEKEGSKEVESSSQLSYVLFRERIIRLQIRREKVEAIFMLMDPTFKQKDQDVKIKETKTTIRIENNDYYNLAINTLNKKYQSLLDQRAERDNQRRQERLEKSRQKRLEKADQNKTKGVKK